MRLPIGLLDEGCVGVRTRYVLGLLLGGEEPGCHDSVRGDVGELRQPESDVVSVGVVLSVKEVREGGERGKMGDVRRFAA
jgi:hypothetical protein